MLSGKNKKKIEKAIEVGLKQELKLNNARKMLTNFIHGNDSYRAISIPMVIEAYEVLFDEMKTAKKKQKVSAIVARLAEKIDENATIFQDLVSDMVFETSNLLDILSLSEEDQKADDAKKTQDHIIRNMPDIPSDTDDDDDDKPRGETIAAALTS